MASAKTVASLKNRQCVKDYILTAIDQLKQRKARPDRYRIAYVLSKQFGVDVEAANDTLEQMTDEHKIVRVDYKGSVSYRDIRNWIRVNDNIQGISMYGGAFILNSDRASAAIHEAVKSLALDKNARTVTLAEVEKYFKDKAHNQYTTAPLAVALQREVNAGHLLKAGVNVFALQTSKKQKQEMMVNRTESPTSEGTSDGNDAINDNGKRVKKTKVIFDPSETRPTQTDQPAAKRAKKMVMSALSSSAAAAVAAAPAAATAAATATSTSTVTTTASTTAPARRVCNFCHKQTKHEVVLVCRQCQTPAHPSCLGYSRRLAKVVQNHPWTCMDCKTCKLCRDVGGELIFCDKCDEAYHMVCHRPVVRRKPVGEWMCLQCRGGKPGPGRPAKLAWKPQSPPARELLAKPAAVAASQPKVAQKTAPKPALKLAQKPAPKSVQKPAQKPVQKPAQKPQPKPAPKPAPVAVAVRLDWPLQLLDAPVDPSVPDASGWSTAEVAAYFSRHGFAQHADAFRKHEVDGPALLMLARMDVLRGLGLKLGPALKVYNHVKLLQTRRRACLDFCLL